MENIDEPLWQNRKREELGRTGRLMKSIHPKKVFFITQEVMVNIMIVYIIVVLVAGLGGTLMDARHLVHMMDGDGFTSVVAEILSFLVMIELFRQSESSEKSKVELSMAPVAGRVIGDPLLQNRHGLKVISEVAFYRKPFGECVKDAVMQCLSGYPRKR